MKYYHNPRCSNSRQGLTFLPSSVEIILYRKEEVSALVYRSLLQRYEGNLIDLLRIQESPAKGLDLNTYSIEDLAEFLTLNPIVLQRPILDAGESIIIGRGAARRAPASPERARAPTRRRRGAASGAPPTRVNHRRRRAGAFCPTPPASCAQFRFVSSADIDILVTNYLFCTPTL